MNIQLQIDKNALLAAAMCAAQKDIRYYLNGVNVEFVPGDKEGTLVLTGTDGHILFAGTVPAVWLEGEQTAPFSMIIPLDVVKAACKAYRKMSAVILSSLPDGKYTLGDTVFATIDAKYPDYRRVIPAKVSGEIGQYDADYLARGQDALRTYFGKGLLAPTLNHNGTGSAVMCGASKDALVVLMPWRHDEAAYEGHAIPDMPQELKKAA